MDSNSFFDSVRRKPANFKKPIRIAKSKSNEQKVQEKPTVTAQKANTNDEVTGIIKDQKMLKGHVEELKKDQNDLMLKTIEIEAKAFEGKIIIRNLPLTKKLENMRENNKQSREIVKRFLQHANLNLTDTVEIYRLYSKDEKPNRIPPMIVKFRSRFEYFTLMRKINEIKKIESYKFVQVQQFVPPMLINDFNKASKVAFDLRKSNKKTRIDIIKSRIILRVKDPKDNTYKEVNYDYNYHF